MKKIIFLDIDGVIATPNNIKKGLWALQDDKQILLGKILNETNAKIVLSSSWRLKTLEETKEKMKHKGFWYLDELIGITIRGYSYICSEGLPFFIPRGLEIRQWIDANLKESKRATEPRMKYGVDYNYVILDDDSDMLLEQKDNFVNTNWREGLTQEDVKKAIEILNKFD